MGIRQKHVLLKIFLFSATTIFSQDIETKQKGTLSLGGRSTISTFNDGKWRDNGTGIGGQFRIRVGERVNTDWFFDYITSDIGNYASRTDYHIGWSVLYYLTKQKLQPYILAGHCFDYTYMTDNLDLTNHADRWSSAVQVGGGMSYNLSSRADISLTSQYMIHLTEDIHILNNNGAISFIKDSNLDLEGHILCTISVNYKIFRLW